MTLQNNVVVVFRQGDFFVTAAQPFSQYLPHSRHTFDSCFYHKVVNAKRFIERHFGVKYVSRNLLEESRILKCPFKIFFCRVCNFF